MALEVVDSFFARIARQDLIPGDYCVRPGELAPFGSILLDDGYTQRDNRCQHLRYDELRYRKSVAVELLDDFD